PACEFLGGPLVAAGEARVRAELVVRDDHPDRLVADDQRHVEPGARIETACDLLEDLGILEQRVDTLAAAALEDAADLRVARDGRRAKALSSLAVDRLDTQLRACDERDRDDARIDQLPQSTGDELQQSRQL